MAEKHNSQSAINEQSKIRILQKLKQWIGLSEAAHHLSRIFEEKITEADLLQLALNRHLQLSVRFANGVPARPGVVVPIEDAKYKEVESIFGDGLIRIPDGGIELFSAQGAVTHMLNLEPSIVILEGVYDLPMIGAERLDIEHNYQMLVNGSTITGGNLEGVFLEGGKDKIFQLLERFEEEFIEKHNVGKRDSDPLRDYFPAGGLPDEAMFVVRVSSLIEFEKSIQRIELLEKEPKPDKLHKSKEDNYLEVIAVLFAALDLPHDNMNRADGLLRAHAASQGQDVPSSPTTTSNIFKAALALNSPKKSQ